MNDGYVIVSVVGVLAGLVVGHMMFRSDYCLVGMLRDRLLFGEATMLRFLVLQVAATMVLLEVARLLGALPYYPALLMGPANAGSVVGGFIFGVGMVLAGSCVIGCLYRVGSGSILSFCTLCAMIAGASLFAEFAGRWQGLTRHWQLAAATTLPQSFNLSPGWLVWPLVAVLALWVWQWWQRGLMQLPATAEGFIQPWRVALVLAMVTLLCCLATGLPLGVTTCYVKLGAWLEHGIWPAHVAANRYFNHPVLDYVPPWASQAIRGGAGPGFDAIAALQLTVILGILIGAFGSAWRIGEFHWQFRLPLRHYALAIVGGLLVGLGSRMAPGCNVWHLLGGLPVLAWNALLFTLGLVPGTWLGGKLLMSCLK